MKNILYVKENSLFLNGFDGMSDFSIGMNSERIVIFPKLLPGNTFQFLFPERNTNSPDCQDAIAFIKAFYQIDEDNFSLTFEVFPATGNYLCTTVNR